MPAFVDRHRLPLTWTWLACPGEKRRSTTIAFLCLRSGDSREGSARFQNNRWFSWLSLRARSHVDKLDGISKKTKKQSMEDFLSLPDDYESRRSAPGKKRVRLWRKRRVSVRLGYDGCVLNVWWWQRKVDAERWKCEPNFIVHHFLFQESKLDNSSRLCLCSSCGF